MCMRIIESLNFSILLCKLGIQGHDGEKHTVLVTAKTEAGGKLVGLKTFRNGKFKRAVAFAAVVDGGEEDFVKQFRRL